MYEELWNWWTRKDKNKILYQSRPLNGGQHCYGLTTGTEHRQCNTNPCPVDGKWSSWSSWRGWSTCTKNCGTGNQVRTRSRYCTNPRPLYGGNRCPGLTTAVANRQCNTNPCPIDGEWSSFGSWSPWSSCNVTCGGGTKYISKTRTCTHPEPKYGGQSCNGSTTETSAFLCNSMACPIDGEWSSFGSWSPWSSCNVTCGGGTKSRSKNRTCTNPEPKYGGQTCNGSTTETTAVLCNSMACPTSEEQSSNAAVIGGTIGGLLFLLLVIIIIVLLWRTGRLCEPRKQQQDNNKAYAYSSGLPDKHQVNKLTEYNNKTYATDDGMEDIYLYGGMKIDNPTWLIPHTKIVLEEKINSGRFADIFKARYDTKQNDMTTVVAKNITR
ncbi:Hemicentin-1,Coadhesin,Thrombospondin-2,Thrombospondin-1,Mucin-like protein [Mytilus edulis]|uniref:Hemicentin-1,Coadhesin,Thrombospondin-2,Thrombosp ondin-1,Mucin-like protein n=1 Tax=Mytilus edulis TaxID=6550 RepID=A0A8S3RY02_MYTED|nr:Hemicentin-1,Coadhesin,Thrombospondin-2,Thrombospondin-1,Mucin-like protein [Mytilus edulis]